MMMYKQAEFEDEDSSSIGSVALNSEGISTSATHIRYNSVGFYTKVKQFNREDKVLVHVWLRDFKSAIDRYSRSRRVTILTL